MVDIWGYHLKYLLGLINGEPAPDSSQGRPERTSTAAMVRGALIFWAAKSILTRLSVVLQ
jgi:hypothetical protein